MQDYSRPLGDALKRARGESGYTQRQVADKIGKDVRTVLNIENYKGNPKLEVLYPLIRAMNIDAREVFYPELQRESPAIRQLRLLVEECNEDEAAALIPVFKSVLNAMRTNDSTDLI
ncbi:MAG: helix-turn-helix transcriptional regulator [Oscillospiraceae bacterium]|nr:helix-turn-helix transcriptional regulator [Oscillospiraceae bacterium]